MIEAWADYAPGDLLLFSEEVYRRLFARANAAASPWPVLATPLLAAAIALAAASPRWAAALPLTLAAGWAGAALTFLPLYAEVNWAVDWVVPLFWAQAAALALTAERVRRRRLDAPRPPDRVASAVALAAVAAHPVAELLAGRSPEALQTFAVAPDATALATLGCVALLRRRGEAPAALMAAPLLWGLASVATLLTLGASVEGWLLAISCLAVAAFGLAERPATRARF